MHWNLTFTGSYFVISYNWNSDFAETAGTFLDTGPTLVKMTKLRHRAVRYLVQVARGNSSWPALLTVRDTARMKADLKRWEFLPSRSFSSNVSGRIPSGRVSPRHGRVFLPTSPAATLAGSYFLNSLWGPCLWLVPLTKSSFLVIRSDSKLETGSPPMFVSSLASVAAGLMDRVPPAPPAHVQPVHAVSSPPAFIT